LLSLVVGGVFVFTLVGFVIVTAVIFLSMQCWGLSPNFEHVELVLCC
jgi:hypothetical protein